MRCVLRYYWCVFLRFFERSGSSVRVLSASCKPKRAHKFDVTGLAIRMLHELRCSVFRRSAQKGSPSFRSVWVGRARCSLNRTPLRSKSSSLKYWTYRGVCASEQPIHLFAPDSLVLGGFEVNRPGEDLLVANFTSVLDDCGKGY
jgi:hypothetical protein